MNIDQDFQKLLHSQWSPDNEKPFSYYSPYSHYKAVWECEKGHKWSVRIDHRTISKSGCPFCIGKQAWSGFNDLKTLRPDLAAQWHPFKNGNLKPENVTLGSNKIVTWKCPNGHEWKDTVKARVIGFGCPYDSGKRAWPGFNDLKTLRPDLAEEWHPFKNGDLQPENVTRGSRKKIFWLCPKGHEYIASTSARTSGRNCPFCSHKSATPFDDNDSPSLSLKFPTIASEWDYEKNDTTPDKIYAFSNRFAWWKCKEGHRWYSVIITRTRPNRPGTCPYCSGKRAISGKTDLATVYPDLLSEWDFEKNSINPSKILPYSHKMVWWKCSKNHSYLMRIANKTNGKGCPICYHREG